jgi:hypothetical protein
VAHELGHQLDSLYGLEKDSEVKSLWDEAVSEGVKDSISGYAEKGGIVEGIAEGWAEAFGSGVARKFAEGLKRRIFKLKGSP